MPDLRLALAALLADLVAATEPPAAALPELVRAHVAEVRAAARRDELLPLDLAEAIAAGLDALFALAVLTPEQARLVAGAARYFVSNADLRPDLGGPLGLDDDAMVFNHVAARLGRADLVVEL